MTVGKKLSLGFAVVVVQAVVVGAASHWAMRQTSQKLGVISAQHLPMTERAAQVEREVLNARIHFIYFVTIQKAGALEKGWERFRNAQKSIAELEKLIAQSVALSGARAEMEQLRRDFDSYQPVLVRIIDVVNQHQNQGPEFAALIVEWARLGGAMVDSAGRLAALGSETTNQLSKDAAAQLSRTLAIMAGVGLSGLLIGLAAMAFQIRGLNRVLERAVAGLSEGAAQVSSSSGQVSGLSQSLAEGASRQAASLEETTASSAEMSSMTHKNAENSQQAAALMNLVAERVAEANRTLAVMVTSMQEIDASSGKISKIIKVIDEIAFQTNILALNAAVEAARAGEAGLGFAVVADEVRNLAQRSAQAARDTASLIEESILKSRDGGGKLGEVASSIEAITQGAGKVKTLVDEVEASSKDQARGIDQISKAVSGMEQLTQQTAAHAEESAASSQELNAQAQSLMAVVGQLRELVRG